MKLLVKDIVEVDAAQCRYNINSDAVSRYADHLQSGGTLPPIKVAYEKATGRYILFDGAHTLRAHKKIELLEIDADVEEGDETLAAWWAIAQNSTHGLTRTIQDREKAILQALQHPMSKDMTEADLAHYIGTSRREVFRVRQKFETPKTDRKRDPIYEDSLNSIREASPQLADEISVGICPMSKEEVITLAGKEANERDALIPVIREHKVGLRAAEKICAYKPRSEDLSIKTYIDFVERNPEQTEFYFRDHQVLASFTVNDA